MTIMAFADELCLMSDGTSARLAPCSSSCRQQWIVGALIKSMDQHAVQSASYGELDCASVSDERERQRCSKVKQMRVFCFVTAITVSPEAAYTITTTYARHCSTLLFFVDKPVVGFEKQSVGVELSAEQLEKPWTRDQFAWTYVQRLYGDSAEWFLKVLDQTYVVMPNLKYYLAGLNENDPHELGRLMHYIPNPKETYIGGGWVGWREKGFV